MQTLFHVVFQWVSATSLTLVDEMGVA